MKQISLKSPVRNGAPTEETFDELIAVYEEIYTKLRDGKKVYVRYVTGERKGSIAYIKDEYDLDNIIPHVRYSHHYWDEKTPWRCDFGFHCRVAWEGRRNVVRCYIGNEVEYLPDYTGPTIWEKFDKKAAEKEATEEIVIEDRDGNILQIGDRVLYINARYGGAAQLDRGVIKDIKVKVSKHGERTYSKLQVIIDNDEGEKSTLTSTDKSVVRIEK